MVTNVLVDCTTSTFRVELPSPMLNSEDVKNTLLKNVGNYLQDHTVSKFRRPQSTTSPL
jgi:hypothetical protein